MSAYYPMSSVTGDYKRRRGKLALTQTARTRPNSFGRYAAVRRGEGKLLSSGATEEHYVESFPQKGDEFSTCGKGAWMKLAHGAKSRKIGQKLRENFF
jgi:hypothetical protein